MDVAPTIMRTLKGIVLSCIVEGRPKELTGATCYTTQPVIGPSKPAYGKNVDVRECDVIRDSGDKIFNNLT